MNQLANGMNQKSVSVGSKVEVRDEFVLKLIFPMFFGCPMGVLSSSSVFYEMRPRRLDFCGDWCGSELLWLKSQPKC